MSLKPPDPLNTIDFSSIYDQVEELGLNLRSFGAKGDGVTDDTVPTIEWLAAGPNLYAPPGTYMVDPDVLIRAQSGLLRGAGMHSVGGTIFKARSAGGAILRLSAQYDRVQGIRFDGAALANYGLVVHSFARGLLENTYVTQCQLDGILFHNDYLGLTHGNSNSCAFNKVVTTDNNGNGIRAHIDDIDTNAITFTSVTSTLNNGHGIYWIGGDGLTMLGGHAEGNDGYGIKLGDAASAGFAVDTGLYKPWVENNGLGGVRFEKASRCHYWRISACQGATWAADGALCVMLEEANVGSQGTIGISSGTDGRRITISNDRLISDSGTDTNRVFYVTPKGNGGLGIGAAAAATPTITTGTGTPEGQIGAPIGSIFQRKDGGAGTSVYFKESGAGSTGWVGK